MGGVGRQDACVTMRRNRGLDGLEAAAAAPAVAAKRNKAKLTYYFLCFALF